MAANDPQNRPAPHDGRDQHTGATAPTIAQWGRLKRLSFVLDETVKRSPLKGSTLSEPDGNGVRYLGSAESPAELDEIVQLLYDMDIVSPKHDWTRHTGSNMPDLPSMDFDATCLWITAIVRGDRFSDGRLADEVNRGAVQRLCRHAYALALTKDGWPTALVVDGTGRIRTGTVVRSIDASIEGRATGGRRRCTATGRKGRTPTDPCAGWQIDVHWETGQRMRICSEGWHYDPDRDEIQVIGGGEISARFVSPPPLGTPPRPRNQWPARSSILSAPAWRSTL